MEMTTLDELNAAIDRLEYLALARAENANDRDDARSAAERAHAAINALPGLLAICNAAKTALGLLDDPSCPVTGLDETRRARAILAAALKEKP
jgi:hypothetical protein